MADAFGNDTHGAALDPAAVADLRDLVGGDEDTVRDVVEAFLEDAPGQIDQLRSGLEHGDATLVRRAAHTLKGNGSVFGAVRFADRCRALEEAAKDGSLEDAEGMIAGIEHAWADVRPAIERLGAGAGP